jgi:REP element-mobilizing transposase RayT
MPNHIHAIVMIDGDKTPHEKRNTACLVKTFHETSLQPQPIKIATQMQSWLSVVVRQFKQSVTRYANANSISFAWQTRFHDRIIRDHDEMNRIAEYIEQNPAKWETDCYNE